MSGNLPGECDKCSKNGVVCVQLGPLEVFWCLECGDMEKVPDEEYEA